MILWGNKFNTENKEEWMKKNDFLKKKNTKKYKE